ncbi:hypothetical protein V8C86DRAFT_2593571, partial [Haematococcus lacustris]
HQLVLWGRWEWYINILRSARLGRGSREPLLRTEAPQSQQKLTDSAGSVGLGDTSEATPGQRTSGSLLQRLPESAGSAGTDNTSESPDDITALLLSVQFAVEREEAFLEALHLAGCPYDLHTQLRLPKSWPVTTDTTSGGQLQQLLSGTVDALVQLPDSAVRGPGIMAATADVISHRRKMFEMYATPSSGPSNGTSPDPPLAGDPSPNSPAAFKRDVSLTMGAEFLLGCALTNNTEARLTIDVTQEVISQFMPFFGKRRMQDGGGGGSKSGAKVLKEPGQKKRKQGKRKG